MLCDCYVMLCNTICVVATGVQALPETYGVLAYGFVEAAELQEAHRVFEHVMEGTHHPCCISKSLEIFIESRIYVP